MSNNLTPEILDRYRELALWYGDLAATEIIERIQAAESAIARVEALAGRYDKVADACMMNGDRELIRSAAFDIRAALKDGA